MRSKEDAKDYRYFPDPDLPPVHISDEWIDRIVKSMPESSRKNRHATWSSTDCRSTMRAF